MQEARVKKQPVNVAKDFEHPIIELLDTIRTDYKEKRFTFVKGEIMEEILRFFGATEEDLLSLQCSGNHLGDDPTLPFRKSRNGRFSFNFHKSTIERLAFQPFVLSADEDFVRDDSGALRHFRGIQDDVQHNTAFQALLRFKGYVIDGFEIKKRKNLQDTVKKWISTVFQLRTITSRKLLGEPAKEGVHSDGVEHTMTTFIRAQNMTNESAISQLHSEEQKTGVAWNEIDEEFIMDRVQHRHYLDTLLIVDTELKHSLSPVYALDTEKEANRDMIIFFTRRPKDENHSSYCYDSLDSHKEIPLTINLR